MKKAVLEIIKQYTAAGDCGNLCLPMIKALSVDAGGGAGGVGTSQLVPISNEVKIERPFEFRSPLIEKSLVPNVNRRSNINVSNLNKRSRLDINQGKVSDDVPKASEKMKLTQAKVSDNMYEAKFRSQIVPPSEINVSLEDIGALEDTKSLIERLVVFPIKRPQIFKSSLLRPCKNILLFGPPGTGKTMLAQAIARDCGANLINVSGSSFSKQTSTVIELNVKALFTLAAKVAPMVVFLDEIDRMFGKHASQFLSVPKVKNEFLSLWNDLRKAEAKEHIIVLGATNRPFDLDDEAIIKHFERSRESILKKILEKETVDNIDFKEVAHITDGYSGSDLKKLCATAAFQPLADLMRQEKSVLVVEFEVGNEEAILRPLNMDDLKHSKNNILPSSANGLNRVLWKKWNDLYGDRVSK